MTNPIDIANQQQREASNPLTSAFVTASAGSGKTKLLTDRLLRLMLSGAVPSKILCMTYTKAAAAEMSIRLNNKLGQWVAMPQEALAQDIIKLDLKPNKATLENARKLFADVLDLPGGMKISTVHSFCQSLLRRFPLEAQLSPYFKLEDELDSVMRLRDARESVFSVPASRDRIATLAAETTETEFVNVVNRILGIGRFQNILQQHSPASVLKLQEQALGAVTQSEHEIIEAAIENSLNSTLRDTLEKIREHGTMSGKRWAEKCLLWLSQDLADKIAGWEVWLALHFTKAGSRIKLASLIGKKLQQDDGDIIIEIDAEHARLEHVLDLMKSSRLTKLNADFISIASEILNHQLRLKHDASVVSFTDLISKTLSLMSDPEDVRWILYKLDGGLDHLLLDEVQDIAPEQWRITNALADDFFSGDGGQNTNRSIFAVGDPKQSIFSFQGADLSNFEASRKKFKNLALGANRKWLDGHLSVSFRSTEPILKLVDEIFSAGPACVGVCEPNMLRHGVSRVGQAGKAVIWPLVTAHEPPAQPEWDVAEHYATTQSAAAQLAEHIARHIRACLDSNMTLPSRGRRIGAGDFLILVRHRDELVSLLTKTCKQLDIPIAGPDRLVLTEQQAVSDLIAVCDALLLPSNDLAFAQFLVSPIGGLSDESLMALALDRRGNLAAALHARWRERPDWQAAYELFHDLREQVDFISPYALLATILGPFGGRKNLLARLGSEAAESIDELLSEAQKYTRGNPASLQQFLHALRLSGATIKRETEAAGGLVRIMTVHGAKGLQAPIVIMPDTTSVPRDTENFFWLDVPGRNEKAPIFCPSKDLRTNNVQEAIASVRQNQRAEYNRLLYVALTRAEDEIIICGAEGRRAAPPDCWYHLVKRGFDALGANYRSDGARVIESQQTGVPDRPELSAPTLQADLPRWSGSAPDWQATAPAGETLRRESLAPSQYTDQDVKSIVPVSPLLGAATTKLSQQFALQRGKIIHSILQYLPDVPALQRPAVLQNFLRQPGLGLNEPAQDEIYRKMISLLDDQSFAGLFGPGSRAEVPVTGLVGGVEIGGLIDRLAITQTQIFIADYKTDRLPPPTIDKIPMSYLKQLAAYALLVGQIFPKKDLTCFLIWTETANAMQVPSDLLRRHEPMQGRTGFVVA